MTTPRAQPGRARRLAYFATGLLVLAILTIATGGIWLRAELRGSLATLDGEVPLAGLGAGVLVERDDAGVPTLHATDRRDLARATGFLHAQERFFQMDLLRRRSAGELAELIGRFVLESDREARVHRFREISRNHVTRTDSTEPLLYRAYAEGVNAGLAALDAVPPEYLLLRSEPAEWLPEDSLLVFFSMYLDLQGGSGTRESSFGLVHELLPPELASFLTPAGTEWDAPLIGEAQVMPPIPDAAAFDLRALAAGTAISASVPLESQPIPGSNNFAVAGSRTVDGTALLANDMHLSLRMPNIWYRMSFVLPDTSRPGENRRVTGVTLPGAPPMIVGSNGDVAWGFTNSQVDTSDLIVIELDPDDEDRYRTPDGSQPFVKYEERIRVKGEDDDVLEIVSTRWGPIVDRDHAGRPRALRWIAHDTGEMQLGIFELEQARDIDEAMDIANRASIPTQNFVTADSGGRIGWTLMGPVPRRVGLDGSHPTSWADGTRLWEGRLGPGEVPRLTDPQDGLLWTANNRTVGPPLLARVGDDGYALGARARQIRDDLRALSAPATPQDLLAIQLDDRALLLERWRSLLLEILDDEALAADARRRELRRVVEEDWSGHASVDSAGYRLVRGYRSFLSRQVFDALTRTCTDADERFRFLWIGQWEGPLWELIKEQPPHLLDPRFASWREQLLAAVDTTLDYFLDEEHPTLAGRTWGQRNRVRMQHPLSLAVPQLGAWLDMPVQGLPGDGSMPRVQSPTYGASQRMVVAPGHEDEGIFHMPGGQSGHPLSPHYRKGHAAWASGAPSPFLPGPTAHRLNLVPK